MVILPSSFVNSPRYLHEYTRDEFAYIRTHGCPDLFITFTSNPTWQEIVDELLPGQKSIHRHDIVARVFRLKVKKLMSVITKGKIYGWVLRFLYSVEWQKKDDFAKSLLYFEVPRYYTWNTSTRKWKRRIQVTPVQNWPGVKSGDALAQIRKDKEIAIAVASSGIAATLLDGGQTAHLALKLPLNLVHEETPICNFTKNSEHCRMLQHCKLLVWDECTMSHKSSVETLNRTMKDINNNQSIMGGMVVLMTGDFRQILPVITRGTPADEINACLKESPLWEHAKKFNFTTNMRLQLFNDTESG
ncbi:hypothetical protein AVEN_24933-1 [Araneus ventricosus]|uniref:ATP-dependent DNA helicase n=1 Tax=Araneus ventricosus TaxID=182803 RepID=A0A4Y2P6C3_ARAVE|nr:hypothetical protein AVEN_24933-1 [Araneus ventricosus]